MYVGYFIFLIILKVISCLPVIINTTNGPIEGRISYNGRIREFLSIPYALPPVGDNRWRNPLPALNHFNLTYNATIEPWGCPQHCTSNLNNLCPPYVKEDCLILSIFTPNKISINPNGYPIMIYFHGGGWMENYGGGCRLNVSNVVNFTFDTIIVLINYRLGALGMLYDQTINISGNFAHFDQMMAIEWIYNNSINIGGDKNNIMIYGESAGANSGLLHLIQNTKKYPSYITGIIMESAFGGQRWHNTTDWGITPIQFSEKLNCSMNLTNTERLKCLKSKNSTEIVRYQSQAHQNHGDMIKWSMTVKNDLFPNQPVLAIQSGNYNKNISIIMGSNNCEICLSYKQNQTQNSQQFISSWTGQYGQQIVNKMINYYNVPINTSQNLVNYSIAIGTDTYVKCPARNVLMNVIKDNSNNHYFYHFMYASQHLNQKLYPNERCWNNVCHTEELWWVHDDDLMDIINDTFNEQELKLKNQFILYWTNFAQIGKNVNINNSNSNKWIDINWNTFTQNKQNTLLFDIGQNMKMVENFDSDPCDFWDEIGYIWLNGLPQ